MTKKIPAQPDFWAQGHFKSLLRDFQKTHDAGEKYLTSIRARDFERAITNVILPLLRDMNRPGALEQHATYEEMAAILHDVSQAGHKSDLNFPPDGGKNLVLDRLDAVEAMLRTLLRASRLNYVEIDSDGDNIRIDFRPREERRAA